MYPVGKFISASFLFRSVKLILLGSLLWQVSYFVRSFCRYSKVLGSGKFPHSFGKYSKVRGFVASFPCSFVRSFCRYSEAFGFGKLPRSRSKYSEAHGFGEFHRSLSNNPKLVRLNNATYKNWGTSQMYPSTSRVYSCRRSCS